MADIRLLEFVLLACDFEAWPTRGEVQEQENAADSTLAEAAAEAEGAIGEQAIPEEPPGNLIFDYPDGDFLKLSPKTFESEDHYFLALMASIDDPAFPFKLDLTVGSRFFVGRAEDGSRATVEEAESTLVWLSYPYLRQTVSEISGRSPLPPYFLPALTKLPHPSVMEEE